MTDYLEELLDESKGEDLLPGPGTVLPPPRKPPVPRTEEAPKRVPLPGDDLPEGERAVPPPELPPVESRDSSPALPRWAAEEGEGPLWADWRPRPPARPEGASLLLRALRRTERSLLPLRRGTALPARTLTEVRPNLPAMDPETLDLAVQRDARRYDGGFPLY